MSKRIDDNDSSSPTPLGIDAKERTSEAFVEEGNNNISGGIGAASVNERAPNLNQRFFRGIPTRRKSQRELRRQRILGQSNTPNSTNQPNHEDVVEGDDAAPSPLPFEIETRTRHENGGIDRGGEMRRMSAVSRRFSAMFPRASVITLESFAVTATLVDDDEVFEAERVNISGTKRWKMVVFSVFFLIPAIAVALFGVYFFKSNDKAKIIEDVPSISPSSPPSFDSRPTLVRVQERKQLLCGAREGTTESGAVNKKEGFMRDLCHAVSSVVLGGRAEFFREVYMTDFQWADQLINREADVLFAGVTHTLQRETREPQTGEGFSFSSPYFYDGLRFAGNETLVKCAENQKRYGVCERLSICVKQGTTHHAYVSLNFPSNFVKTGSLFEELVEMMINGTCNVIGTEEYQIFNSEIERTIESGQYVLGNKSFTKEPLSAVTRNDDREWSDIVNWVIQMLIYGESKNTTQNLFLCENEVNGVANATMLNYEQSIYCAGNYAELFNKNFEKRQRSLMNTINDGTAMVYSIPLGDIMPDIDGAVVFDDVDVGDSVLNHVKSNDGKVFRCGVINIVMSVEATSLSVDYCHVVAAALFNGNSEAIEIVTYGANDTIAYDALSNKSIDALVGAVVNFQGDVYGGFSYSTPYFFAEDGTDNFYAFATRENDTLFSSFINAMVVATIHAQEIGVTRETSSLMPLVSLFGSDFLWAMRDAVSYGGNYDELYENNFESRSGRRGRNEVNSRSGPQLLAPPEIMPDTLDRDS